jgi:Cu/Ag efflux protein CusF
VTCLLLTGPAFAQSGGGQMGGMGGGGMGGGHGGHGGKGGKQPDSGTTVKKPSTGAPDPADKPTSDIVLTGIVTAVEPATNRVTIAYDAVDELNWPRGTMPFPVAKDELLKDVKVGQKINFKVEDHEIYEIKPAPASKAGG